MKTLLLILFFLPAGNLHSQNSAKFDSTINFIREQGIKLNTVIPPPGFSVFYNCDSLLFMRGNFGDTIKIWTSAMDWYRTLEEFKPITKYKRFGKTEFVKSIDLNGRIFVSSYHQTEFIYRNDSLLEIENSNPTPTAPLTNLFSARFKKEIDDSTYKARYDSLTAAEKGQAIHTPKLIFTKTMFQKNRKKVKLSKKINFEGDTIILEHEWNENGKKCYLVRINNKDEDGEETSYAYAIDDDMKFVSWEGCKGM